jgi:hypothetical protein
MTMPEEPTRPLLRRIPRRLKIAVVSLLSFVVTTACSLARLRSTVVPEVTCYAMVAPTEPPTPAVLCYEMVAPTPTPTCYTATAPPTELSTATPPTSPLGTPTPTSTVPLEARRQLLEGLLADGRFPQQVVWQLRDWQPRQPKELSEG